MRSCPDLAPVVCRISSVAPPMLGAVPPFARSSSITLSFQSLIVTRSSGGKSSSCNHCAHRTLRDMTNEEAQRWAEQWIDEWNRHDVEAVLEHFADDVVFVSPVAATVTG